MEAIGIDGGLTLPDIVGTFATYSLSFSQILVPVDGFGELNVRRRGGKADGSFDFSGHARFNQASSNVFGTTYGSTGQLSRVPGQAVFTIASGCTITVDVILERLNFASETRGDTMLSGSGYTDGDRTVAWDETGS